MNRFVMLFSIILLNVSCLLTLGNSYGYGVIYNCTRHGDYCTVLYDVESKKEKILLDIDKENEIPIIDVKAYGPKNAVPTKIRFSNVDFPAVSEDKSKLAIWAAEKDNLKNYYLLILSGKDYSQIVGYKLEKKSDCKINSLKWKNAEEVIIYNYYDLYNGLYPDVLDLKHARFYCPIRPCWNFGTHNYPALDTLHGLLYKGDETWSIDWERVVYSSGHDTFLVSFEPSGPVCIKMDYKCPAINKQGHMIAFTDLCRFSRPSLKDKGTVYYDNPSTSLYMVPVQSGIVNDEDGMLWTYRDQKAVWFTDIENKIENIAWNPDGDKVLFVVSTEKVKKGTSPKVKDLVVANKEGCTIARYDLKPLGYSETARLEWSSNNLIAVTGYKGGSDKAASILNLAIFDINSTQGVFSHTFPSETYFGTVY